MVLGPARVYLHPGFLDSANCHRVRAAMDRAIAEPAEILDQEIAVDTEARRALSIEIDADTLAVVEEAIDAERVAIAAFFAETLIDREGAGFLRYVPGGFYRPHRDRGSLASWPGAERRRIAVIIFLNDGFSGGVLRLFGDERAHDIVPREGTLAAFSATTVHEVTPVIDGTRDTVVDWFY